MTAIVLEYVLIIYVLNCDICPDKKHASLGQAIIYLNDFFV